MEDFIGEKSEIYHLVQEAGEHDGLRVVGTEAFCMCKSLKQVKYPDSVEEIGLDAFTGSGLESFVAPKFLKTIH